MISCVCVSARSESRRQQQQAIPDLKCQATAAPLSDPHIPLTHTTAPPVPQSIVQGTPPDPWLRGAQPARRQQRHAQADGGRRKKQEASIDLSDGPWWRAGVPIMQQQARRPRRRPPLLVVVLVAALLVAVARGFVVPAAPAATRLANNAGIGGRGMRLVPSPPPAAATVASSSLWRWRRRQRGRPSAGGVSNVLWSGSGAPEQEPAQAEADAHSPPHEQEPEPESAAKASMGEAASEAVAGAAAAVAEMASAPLVALENSLPPVCVYYCVVAGFWVGWVLGGLLSRTHIHMWMHEQK